MGWIIRVVKTIFLFSVHNSELYSLGAKLDLGQSSLASLNEVNLIAVIVKYRVIISRRNFHWISYSTKVRVKFDSEFY